MTIEKELSLVKLTKLLSLAISYIDANAIFDANELQINVKMKFGILLKKKTLFDTLFFWHLPNKI